MAIEVYGTDNVNDVDLKGEAPFATVKDGDKVHFYVTRKAPGYWPHLVKMVDQVDQQLRFRGIDLQKNPGLEFGPKGDGATAEPYVVSLCQVKYVYRDVPSTYAGWSADKSYALLFLSDEYLKDNDGDDAGMAGHKRLERARGGPKWPAGAGVRIMEDEEELRETKATLRALQEACAAFLEGAHLTESQMSHWNDTVAKHLPRG